LPENVIKMGEPYFTHIGMTPQKIHPFAVVVPPKNLSDPKNPFLPFYQLMLLRKSLSKHTHFSVLLARAYRMFNDEMKLEARLKVSKIMKERFDFHKPDWSIPLTYYSSPATPEAPAIEEPKTLPRIKESEQKATPKPVEIQEDFAPNFDQDSQTHDDTKPTTAEKVKSFIKPLITKKDAPKLNPEKAPPMAADFEAELNDFIDDMDALEKLSAPRPEKW